MNQTNFKVLHYDDTISLHSDLCSPQVEAFLRLQPWRDHGDRVILQRDQTPGTNISRALVITSVGEPTDAASIISPCGDWIDARECAPKSNQTIVVCWLEENEPVDIVEVTLSESEFMKWAIKHAKNPTRAWWRPLPALPDECKGASGC